MESVLPFAAAENENTKRGQILPSRVHCGFASRLAWVEDAPVKIQCMLALNGLR